MKVLKKQAFSLFFFTFHCIFSSINIDPCLFLNISKDISLFVSAFLFLLHGFFFVSSSLYAIVIKIKNTSF
jgi:hypothetical protein